MAYENTRPDSPKGQVYACFKAKGRQAAEKLAEKLGISPSRSKKWMTLGFVLDRSTVDDKAPAKAVTKKAKAPEKTKASAKPKKAPKPKKTPKAKAESAAVADPAPIEPAAEPTDAQAAV
jgi:hypothetical protein